jgi:hypothetical protein
VKLLFDTNVVLDMLLDRQPHALGAAKFAYKDRGELRGSSARRP